LPENRQDHRRIKMQGFIIVDDYAPRFGEFYQQMSAWFGEDKVKSREDMVEGLENAPQAFIGLLEGKNFGKLIIRVARD
jgi:NADPH-dependent curcumin reductase